MSTSAVLCNRPQCTVCGLPVSLETSKVDERGKAVHEECYLLKITRHEAVTKKLMAHGATNTQAT
jgi:hypothetical protein